MTEQPQSPEPATSTQEPATGAAQPSPGQQAGAQGSWSAADGAPDGSGSAGGPAALVSERPEIAVGAAFAGGFALAMILKRLAR